MAKFRLFIDVPLDEDETLSAEKAKRIVNALYEAMKDKDKFPMGNTIQFRMGNDNDRSPRNYLIKDSNGHVTTGKMKLEV